MHIIDLFSEYSVDLCRSYNLWKRYKKNLELHGQDTLLDQ